jgi:hypothetical protein
MTDPDAFREAREAAERFAEAIARYRGASEALRKAVADEALAELAAGLGETVDTTSLEARQKARVRRYLGAEALATGADQDLAARLGFTRGGGEAPDPDLQATG